MTTRDQAIREIDLQLRMLTLSEDKLEDEAVLRDLITVKTEIEVLEIALDGEEPLLVKWLKKAHLKGAMLNHGARASYKKEQSEGSAFPFNARGREHLIDQFNAWSQKTADQLMSYKNFETPEAEVALWIADLDRFKDNPTENY